MFVATLTRHYGGARTSHEGFEAADHEALQC